MRKISFVVSMLACLTILIITGFLNAGDCAEYEMNTDRPGMDYSCYDLPVNDMTAGTSCKSDCDSDSKCIAWTYVKPNTTKPCTLLQENSLTGKKSDSCCISGVKPCLPDNRYLSVDPGPDIFHQSGTTCSRGTRPGSGIMARYSSLSCNMICNTWAGGKAEDFPFQTCQAAISGRFPQT